MVWRTLASNDVMAITKRSISGSEKRPIQQLRSKESPGRAGASIQRRTPRETWVVSRRPDTIPRHKSGKARIATGLCALIHLSPQTSYRFDNCCAGRAKDSDEQQVALHRRKTTTKRSQRREHDQLPHPRVHLRILSFRTYFGDAPTRHHR